MSVFTIFLECEYALDKDALLGWSSPSAFNFIIYGLPNLIITWMHMPFLIQWTYSTPMLEKKNYNIIVPGSNDSVIPNTYLKQ